MRQALGFAFAGCLFTGHRYSVCINKYHTIVVCLLSPLLSQERKMGITKILLRKLSSGVSAASGRGSKSHHGSADRSHPQQNQPNQDLLLDRLGGMVVLGSIVNEFCHRATQDPKLQPFFVGVDHRVLTAHQKRFFAMAFTSINKQKAEQSIRRAHTRLFAMGLSEVHFDIFIHHLSQTLRDRGFGEAIVAEAKAVVAPLREVFRDVSLEYRAARSSAAISSTTSEQGTMNLPQMTLGA